MKAARTVWSRGKDGDYIKVLPIAIMVRKTGNESGDEPFLAGKPIMTTSPCKGEKE